MRILSKTRFIKEDVAGDAFRINVSVSIEQMNPEEHS